MDRLKELLVTGGLLHPDAEQAYMDMVLAVSPRLRLELEIIAKKYDPKFAEQEPYERP